MIIMAGSMAVGRQASRHAWCYSSSWELISSTSAKQRELTGNDMGIRNPKAHPQCHTYSTKAVPPTSSQTIPLTGDQTVKYWTNRGHTHPNHHKYRQDGILYSGIEDHNCHFQENNGIGDPQVIQVRLWKENVICFLSNVESRFLKRDERGLLGKMGRSGSQGLDRRW